MTVQEQVKYIHGLLHAIEDDVRHLRIIEAFEHIQEAMRRITIVREALQ